MREASTRTTLGEWGEQQALEHLEAEGWELLSRNWCTSRGELDLVVARCEPGYEPGSVRQVIAFVEVKTRRAAYAINAPECSVTRRKRQQIVKLAKLWLRAHSGWREASVRFDVIGVLSDRAGRRVCALRHIVGAFDAMGRC